MGIDWWLSKVEPPMQAVSTIDNMSFEEVCEALRIIPDHYNFAKAYRDGLVTEPIWIEKYLVSNMVLAVAMDELTAKIDKLLIHYGVEADG